MKVPVDDDLRAESHMPVRGAFGAAPLRELRILQDPCWFAGQREMADQQGRDADLDVVRFFTPLALGREGELDLDMSATQEDRAVGKAWPVGGVRYRRRLLRGDGCRPEHAHDDESVKAGQQQTVKATEGSIAGTSSA